MTVDQISICHRGVNRAIDLIQSKPSTSLDLEEIADAACLSKFHFSRLFRTLTGETPISFLWRTRLEQSAMTFDQGATSSVTETALNFGFSSPEAYSRAFSKMIGYPPRKYLSNSHPQTPRISPTVQECSLLHGGLRLEARVPSGLATVCIEDLPSMSVAYVRRRGAYNYFGNSNNQIRDGFREIVRKLKDRGVLRPSSMALGIPWNSARLTRPENCLYDICVEIDSSVSQIDDFDIKTIPSGRFVVLKVRCQPREVAEYWNWLSLVWLPKSGEICETNFALERFEAAAILSDEKAIETELCLRLVSR